LLVPEDFSFLLSLSKVVPREGGHSINLVHDQHRLFGLSAGTALSVGADDFYFFINFHKSLANGQKIKF